MLRAFITVGCVAAEQRAHRVPGLEALDLWRDSSILRLLDAIRARCSAKFWSGLGPLGVNSLHYRAAALLSASPQGAARNVVGIARRDLQWHEAHTISSRVIARRRTGFARQFTIGPIDLRTRICVLGPQPIPDHEAEHVRNQHQPDRIVEDPINQFHAGPSPPIANTVNWRSPLTLQYSP
jgi:hypothetical protein